MNPTATILGVRFSNSDARSLAAAALRGGLVVLPSGPVMAASESDPILLEALTNADLAIADSGFMVLLWMLMARQKITRVSGLEYLTQLLARPELNLKGDILWVMPNEKARSLLLAWLGPQRTLAVAELCYVAPVYATGDVRDAALVSLVERLRPLHVIIGLGGGVQEPLGFYLRTSLTYRPGIHCIGAAIGFLTGDQIDIPKWADYLYLGWLFRSLSDPLKYFPRYCRAIALVPLLWRYRERPPSKRQTTK